MSKSAQYNALTSRLAVLRKRFLPTTFSPTASYNSAQLDRARAYRLLAHAEIEHYLEERAKEIALLAVRKWQTHIKPSLALTHIVCNIAGDRDGLPKKPGTTINSTSILQSAANQYFAVLRRNHGVRTENILQILLPIGIQEADLDSVWLNTIDSFGVNRGLAAHSAAVTYTLDPRDELNTVQLVLLGLRDVDLRLNRIRREVR